MSSGTKQQPRTKSGDPSPLLRFAQGADGLHLLQYHLLWMDVSVDHRRRLLTLHHQLEAVQHNEDIRFDRHA